MSYGGVQFEYVPIDIREDAAEEILKHQGHDLDVEKYEYTSEDIEGGEHTWPAIRVVCRDCDDAFFETSIVNDEVIDRRSKLPRPDPIELDL